MCGIAGYYGKKPLPDHRIKSAFKALSHRGPDGQGIYQATTSSGYSVCFLHARLAIIDLDQRASQPMKHESGILSLNGEIYNYQELKAKMEGEGTRFFTQSDTEVLLQMIVQEGIHDAVKKAEGMWAFSFYDPKKEKVHVSRDRFGEKPLYYMIDSTGFYFASEPKVLFALQDQTPRVDSKKIHTYLFRGYRYLHQDDTTYFENVRLLERNTTITLQDGNISEKKNIWDFESSPKPYSNTQEAIQDIKEKLLSAVELRLRSDVPIAFCMSGGVDSMTLISIAKKIFNYDVHGFTIKNIDERYDESELVDQAVQDLKLQHSYIVPQREGFLQSLEAMIAHKAAPIATISYYVHFWLMKEIHKNGYKVSISGTGADELFTGYYDHFLLQLATLQGDVHDQKLNDWEKWIKPLVRNPMLQNAQLFIQDPDFRQHLHSDYSKYEEESENAYFVEMSLHDDLLRNRMLNELFHEAVPVILMEDDSNSMHFSIENRSPFLDSNLFEASLRIPNDALIQDGYAKYILREAVKGIVPEKIRLNRRKVGFNASLFEIMQEDMDQMEDFLEPSSKIFEYVERNKILRLFKDRSASEKFLFNFLCAKIFLDTYA